MNHSPAIWPDNWRDCLAMAGCYFVLPALLFVASHADQIADAINRFFA